VNFAVLVVELNVRPVETVRQQDESGVVTDRAVVVHGVCDAASDKTRRKNRSLVLARIDKVVGIKDRALLRYQRGG
jgi:CO dehydrogenase/acetyl-CoA synthase alpha subunit